jgi:predicted ATPase
MARISQSLLSNLGKPAYQESMFGLGQAIGGLGSQRREQQVRKKEEGMLQGLAPGSVEYNEQLMNIYQSRGELEKAAAMGLKVEEQRNLEEEKQKATRQKTASSQALITDIQGILSQLEGKKDPKANNKHNVRLLYLGTLL